nr:hypothetical protein DWF04_12810 [Cereibacter sphaeroides f. sp. denitrificans]
MTTRTRTFVGPSFGDVMAVAATLAAEDGEAIAVVRNDGIVDGGVQVSVMLVSARPVAARSWGERKAVDAATFAAVMDAVEDCPLSVRKRVAAALRGEAAHG